MIVFEIKQESVAELIAYLTNSALYKEGNVINLVSKSELNELVAQKLEKKDFIGASELLESAKKSLDPNQEVAEIVSKSIRLPFITYFKLIELAHRKGMSLSDTMRITSIPAMKNKLDSLKALHTTDQEKLRVLYDLLEEWENKEPASASEYYTLDFNWDFGEEVKTSFKKFVELSIKERCRKYEFPIELMKDYINSNLDIEKGWEYLDTNAELTLDPQENSLKLTVNSTMSIDFHNYGKFKGSIDSELQEKLDDVLDYEHRMFDVKDDILTIGTDHYYLKTKTISGTLRIEDNKLFFDDVDIEKRTELNALIFEMIANEKYADYAIEGYVNQIREALARNDYDTAAQLNEKLAKFQVIQELSNWYSDLISNIAKGSNVVTFTIPKLLLTLREAAKDNKSIQLFVEENLRKALIRQFIEENLREAQNVKS